MLDDKDGLIRQSNSPSELSRPENTLTPVQKSSQRVQDQPMVRTQSISHQLSPSPSPPTSLQSAPELLKKEIENEVLEKREALTRPSNSPPEVSRSENTVTPVQRRSQVLSNPTSNQNTPEEVLDSRDPKPLLPKGTESELYTPETVQDQPAARTQRLSHLLSPLPPPRLPQSVPEFLKEEIENERLDDKDCLTRPPNSPSPPSRPENTLTPVQKRFQVLSNPISNQNTPEVLHSRDPKPLLPQNAVPELYKQNSSKLEDARSPYRTMPQQNVPELEREELAKIPLQHAPLDDLDHDMFQNNKPFKPLRLQNRSFQQLQQEANEAAALNIDKSVMEVLETPKKEGSTPRTCGEPTTTTVISSNDNPPTILINGQPVDTSSNPKSNLLTKSDPKLRPLRYSQQDLPEENTVPLNNEVKQKEFQDSKSQSYATTHSTQNKNQHSTETENKIMKSDQSQNLNNIDYPPTGKLLQNEFSNDLNSDHRTREYQSNMSTRSLTDSQRRKMIRNQNGTPKSQASLQSGQPLDKRDVQFSKGKTAIPGFTIAPMVPEFDVLTKANQPTFIERDAGLPQTIARSNANVGTPNSRSLSPPMQVTNTSTANSAANSAQGIASPSSTPHKVTRIPISTPNAKGVNIQVESPNGTGSTIHLASTNGDGSNTMSMTSVSSSNCQPGSATKFAGIRSENTLNSATASNSAVSVSN
jgi:hypothetical protein